MLSVSKDISQQRSLISSSHRRKAENAKYAMASRRKSAREPLDELAMAANISDVIGSFFSTGLASFLVKPSLTERTNGDSAIGLRPASWCTHDTALIAVSTAAFDDVVSARCCRYMANSPSLAG